MRGASESLRDGARSTASYRACLSNAFDVWEAVMAESPLATVGVESQAR